TTSRPASAARAPPARARSGCAKHWWRPPRPPRGPKAPTSPARTRGSRPAARTEAPPPPSQYARLKGRRGHARATLAVAHSILVIVYHVLDRGQPYAELGAEYLERRSSDAYRNRLVRQLERLGHKVTLQPADAA